MKSNVRIFVWIFSLLLAFAFGTGTTNARLLDPCPPLQSPVGEVYPMSIVTAGCVFDRDVKLIQGGWQTTPRGWEEEAGEWQIVPVPQGGVWKSQPFRYNYQSWED